MTPYCVLSIPGEPRGWARARASSAGKFVRMHQPRANDEWRALVQFTAREHLGDMPPTRDPVILRIFARWSRPASHSGKRGLRASAPRFRTQKPDVDNLAKGIMDSLNGIVWHDDVQVVHLAVLKSWCSDGEQPSTTVQVDVLDAVPAKEAK